MASNPDHAAIQLEISSAIERFTWNSLGLAELVQGPVARDLVRRAIKVEAAAKRNATNESPSYPGEGPGVVTGLLRGSITWRLSQDAISPYVDIGTSVDYAPFLENGTRYMEPRPFLRPALDAAREDV